MTTLPPAPSLPPCPRVCYFMHAWGPWDLVAVADVDGDRTWLVEERTCTYCGEFEARFARPRHTWTLNGR